MASAIEIRLDFIIDPLFLFIFYPYYLTITLFEKSFITWISLSEFPMDYWLALLEDCEIACFERQIESAIYPCSYLKFLKSATISGVFCTAALRKESTLR